MNRQGVIAVLGLALLSGGAGAADSYVAPDGTPGGDGSSGSPWDLQTALGHPAAVGPGDTIHLEGGRYAGTFKSTLTGDPANPAVFVPMASQAATAVATAFDHEHTPASTCPRFAALVLLAADTPIPRNPGVPRWEAKAGLAGPPDDLFDAPSFPWLDPDPVLDPTAPPALYYRVTGGPQRMFLFKNAASVSIDAG